MRQDAEIFTTISSTLGLSNGTISNENILLKIDTSFKTIPYTLHCQNVKNVRKELKFCGDHNDLLLYIVSPNYRQY